MSMLLASLASAIAFTAILVALHLLKPDFDPARRMISEYAIGRYGWLMQVAFFCWSLSYLLLAVHLWTREPVWLLTPLVLVALGPLGAGVFRTDPIDTLPGAMSRQGRLHTVFGMLFIFGFPLVALFFAFFGSLPLRPWYVATGVFVWLGIGAFIRATIRSVRHDPPTGLIGWTNRIFVGSYVAWVVVIDLAALLQRA